MKQSQVAEKHQTALNSKQKCRKYEFTQDNEIIYEHFLGQREHLCLFFIKKCRVSLQGEKLEVEDVLLL